MLLQKNLLQNMGSGESNCKLFDVPSGIANDRSAATVLNIPPSRGIAYR